MSRHPFEIKRGFARNFALACAASLALAGCGDSDGLAFLKPNADAEDNAVTLSGPGAAALIERDVEAPEVFETQELGLWDGRPSLGGVWAAHPDVSEPERVIIRNTQSGQFVIGALFRKERETPGPRLQISSDAAKELGLIAGQPTDVYVVALRREMVPDAVPEPAPIPAAVDVEDAGLIAPVAMTAGEIKPQSPQAQTDAAIAAATAALDTAPVADPVPAANPAAAPVPQATSKLAKPFLQIGIFSIEDNARRTADNMRSAGIVPSVLEQSSNGKTFWRVIVGPAQNRSEQRALLDTVRTNGFEDAYAVTN